MAAERKRVHTKSGLGQGEALRESFTDRSRQHVVHQGAQTPPVHRSVVSAPHQDLRGPETQHDDASVAEQLRAKEAGGAERRSHGLHVLDGAAEGVGDRAVVN